MILVVAGPTKNRFARLAAKIVTIGTNVLPLFLSVKKPVSPDGVDEEPSFIGEPGNVKARTTGTTVCMEKYIGNIACWREEN